jgi:putative lipoprotein
MLAAVTLTAGIAGSAFAQSEPEAEPIAVDALEGITWVLTSQAIEGEMVPVPERVLVSLLLADGQAGGQGACNGYFTTYELDGSSLTFGQIGSTLMACLPPVMEFEQAYFANLGEVAAYQTTGGPMSLLDADGAIILEFVVAPDTGVVGSWVANGINDQQGENAGVVSSATTPLITAEFSADGDLTGFDGCNNYFTTYEVDGDAITISEMIGSTMMACESDELTEQSQQYFGALVAATTWSVDAGGSLELRDAGGALQVMYLPAE